MADKKVYRSNKDKMIGGVCAGVAEYFDIDPTIVRLAAVLLFFAEGIGLLLYIVAWIVIPEQPLSTKDSDNNRSDTIDVDCYSSDGDHSKEKEEMDRNNNSERDAGYNSENEAESQKKTGNSRNKFQNEKRQSTIGIILIGLGSLFLIDNLFPYFRWHRFWPLVLVGFGVVLLLKGVSDNE